MRKIVLAGATTVTGLVLLLSYPTSRNHALEGAPQAAGASAGGGGTSTGDQSAGSSGSQPGDGTSAQSSGRGTSGTYTGAEVDTRWGIVQVEVTVQGGQVTDAQAVQVPDGNSRDEEINSYAVPILEQETVQAGSAQIDAVSGATVTSEGYMSSLQSALDQAGLR